jgi:hypothetical protein
MVTLFKALLKFGFELNCMYLLIDFLTFHGITGSYSMLAEESLKSIKGIMLINYWFHLSNHLLVESIVSNINHVSFFLSFFFLLNHFFYIDQPISSSLIQDGRPFVHYPLFNSEKITRLIKLGAKFTDTICAASEFIDFMYVLNMTKEEFVAFYDQMFQSKHILNERFKVISGPYYSINPLGPFKPTRFH